MRFKAYIVDKRKYVHVTISEGFFLLEPISEMTMSGWEVSVR